ncbi:MAG: BrnT family toxin [Pseudomonadota bacterium]
MDINFDPGKNETNIRTRGLSFERAADFEFDTAVIEIDGRKAYGEDRYTAIGFLDGRLHVLVFTLRADSLRVISFRKANAREIKRYEQTAQSRNDR